MLDVFLNYDLVIKGSEYARYYFILWTLAEDLRNVSQSAEEIREKELARRRKRKRDDWAEFPFVQPISAEKMLELQKNTARAELFLKERHEKEFILALADKFKGKE